MPYIMYLKVTVSPNSWPHSQRLSPWGTATGGFGVVTASVIAKPVIFDVISHNLYSKLCPQPRSDDDGYAVDAG